MNTKQSHLNATSPCRKKDRTSFLLSFGLHLILLAFLVFGFSTKPYQGNGGQGEQGQSLSAVMVNTDQIVAFQRAKRAEKARQQRVIQEKAQEEARVKAELKAKLEAEQEAKRTLEKKLQAQKEAQRLAEEQVRQKTQQEAQAKAVLEQKLLEEQKKHDLAMAKMKQEADAKWQAQLKRQAEMEAQLQAQAKANAELEANLQAEKEAKRQAKEALEKKKKAEEMKRKKIEEMKRKKAQQQRLAKEQAELQAQEDALNRFFDGDLGEAGMPQGGTSGGKKGQEMCSNLTGYLRDICLPLMRNFPQNNRFKGQECQITLSISSTGEITHQQKNHGTSDFICGAAMEAVQKTRHLPPPPDRKARQQDFTFSW